MVEVVEVTNSRGRVPATCPTGPVSGNQTRAELPTCDFLISTGYLLFSINYTDIITSQLLNTKNGKVGIFCFYIYLSIF